MKNSFILKQRSVSLIIDGKPYVIDDSHANWRLLRDALREETLDWAKIKELVDVRQAVVSYMQGNIQISGGQVSYKGRVIDNYVTRKIIQFMKANEPFKPLVAFLERLLANPSRRAVQELYGFLEHVGLPIDDDGCFYAYKAIRNNWTDKHTGKFDNHIGETPSMERNEVDDDANRGCSKGLHAGDLSYVRDFACRYGAPDGDRIIIVKIDPADVVSVPKEDVRKVRVSRYVVVEEFSGPLPNMTYNPDASEDDEDRYEEDPEDGYETYDDK